MKEIPTFDEWYKNKHGNTFDEYNCVEGMNVNWTIRNLVDSTKDYVSEMIKQSMKGLK